MHDGLIDCLLADMDCLDGKIGRHVSGKALFLFFFFLLSYMPL